MTVLENGETLEAERFLVMDTTSADAANPMVCGPRAPVSVCQLARVDDVLAAAVVAGFFVQDVLLRGTEYQGFVVFLGVGKCLQAARESGTSSSCPSDFRVGGCHRHSPLGTLRLRCIRSCSCIPPHTPLPS